MDYAGFWRRRADACPIFDLATRLRPKKDVLAFLVACFLYVSVSWGDIAPMTYEGYTLSTKANSEIRMQSEEVNIYIGSRCRVTARFEMDNETDKPIDLFVGFPIADKGPEELATYNFRVRVGGDRTPRKIRQVRQEDERGMVWTWFGWDQRFAPGRTLVEVEYHIEPSHSYRQFWLNIYYVLETGRYWKGTIGQVDVAIHFEEPLASEQVREDTAPSGYQINGKRVCWQFKDFEPIRGHNIRLEYMSPAIYRKLQQLRSKVREEPDHEAHVVDLARHCFALGPGGGFTGGFVPGSLPPEQFRLIAARIADPHGKAAFAAAYRATNQASMGGGTAASSRATSTAGQNEVVYGLSPAFAGRLTEAHCRLVHILNAADFLPYEVPEHVLRAKEMLERLLEENPRNAEAWMLYLSNCYRFQFGACAGHPVLHWSPVPPRQKEVVRRAYSWCPSHQGIRLWHEFVTSSEADGLRGPEYLRQRAWTDPTGIEAPLARLLTHCRDAGTYKVRWEP